MQWRHSGAVAIDPKDDDGRKDASIVHGAKCMPTTKEELCMHANPNACCGVGTLEMTLKFGSGGGQASQMEQAKV